MVPNWVLSAPGGPHAGPINLAIRVMSPDEGDYKSYPIDLVIAVLVDGINIQGKATQVVLCVKDLQYHCKPSSVTQTVEQKILRNSVTL